MLKQLELFIEDLDNGDKYINHYDANDKFYSDLNNQLSRLNQTSKNEFLDGLLKHIEENKHMNSDMRYVLLDTIKQFR